MQGQMVYKPEEGMRFGSKAGFLAKEFPEGEAPVPVQSLSKATEILAMMNDGLVDAPPEEFRPKAGLSADGVPLKQKPGLTPDGLKARKDGKPGAMSGPWAGRGPPGGLMGDMMGGGPGGAAPKKKAPAFAAAPDDAAMDLEGEEAVARAIASDKIVAVMFYAPWCGHCKKMKPAVNSIAQHFANEKVGVTVYKADATAEVNKKVAKTFKVRSYPAIHVFTDGNEEPKYVTAPPLLLLLLLRPRAAATATLITTTSTTN